MKKSILLSLFSTFLSFPLFANQTWVSDPFIVYVMAGYTSGEIMIITRTAAVNPAGCGSTDAYIIPPEYNTEAMIQLLAAGKANRRTIEFSVRNDTCRAFQDRNQSDRSDTTFPVIQRIALR